MTDKIENLISRYKNTIDSYQHSIMQWTNRMRNATNDHEREYFLTETKMLNEKLDAYKNIVADLESLQD